MHVKIALSLLTTDSAMGCNPFVCVPTRKGKKDWVGIKKQTLMEKWVALQAWMSRFRKTRVVPITIKPPSPRPKSVAGEIGSAHSIHSSEQCDDVDECSSPIAPGHLPVSTVAQWLVQHENTMETRSYSPDPSNPDRRVRPKAAKGRRTVRPPLEYEKVTLIGAVEEVDEKQGPIQKVASSKTPTAQECLERWKNRKLNEDMGKGEI